MASAWLLGVARMRRKYYYFCSRGSIYRVSTVGRRGRMGKYMKKTKSVQSMEVSQSSLLGVRTRAKALALKKQTSEAAQKHRLTSTPTVDKPCRGSQSLPPPLANEPHYLQLRNRRLEKVSKHIEKGRKSAGDRSAHRASAPEISGSSRPSSSHVEFYSHDEELLDVPPRNSCSSRPDLALMAISATMAPSIDAVSHSGVTLPVQSSLHASSCAAPAAMLTQPRIILGRSSSRMLTRNQRQELNSKLLADAMAMEMDIERMTPEGVSPPGNVQKRMEVDPYFGESPTIAGPSKEGQQGPNTCSHMRECTRDSLIGDVEAPASTSRIGCASQIRASSAPPFSRSNEALSSTEIEALSSTEIEAFFASAEQKERRRFIDRYNFDPLIEEPLKGRYLWLKD